MPINHTLTSMLTISLLQTVQLEGPFSHKVIHNIHGCVFASGDLASVLEVLTHADLSFPDIF